MTRPPSPHHGAAAAATLPLAVAVGSAAILAAGAVAAAGLPVEVPARPDRVRFEDEIMPALAANCTACHNPKIHEGGLALDTLAAVMEGGDSGPAVVPGKPAESVLFLRAAHRQEDFMPPAGNKVGALPLSPAQLGLLERWITEGATGGPPITRRSLEFRPLPAGTGGVVAAAVTRDGRLTAAARGGRVQVFDAATGRGVGSLVDPAIASGGGPTDVAHRDVVTAVEFAPTGDLLATGSFRTIRLWRRHAPQLVAEVSGSAGAVAAAAAPSGGQVALGLPDGRILVCDPRTGQVAHTLAVHASAISGLAFAADGVLISSARDGVVLATRIADGTTVGRLARPGEVRAIATLGSQRLATADADDVIRLWPLPLPPADAAAPPPSRELSGLPQPTAAVAEVPGMAGHLLIGSADGSARLWNADTGSEVRQFPHGSPIVALAVSPDGTRLLTMGSAPGAKLWETATGRLVADAGKDPRIVERARLAEIDVVVARQDLEHARAQVLAAEKAIGAAAEETKRADEKREAARKTLVEKTEAFTKAATGRADADKAAAAAVAAVPAATEAIEAATKAAVAAKAAAEAAAATATAFAKAASGDVAAAEAIKTVQAAAAAATAAHAAAEQAVTQATRHLERAQARVADTAKKAEEAAKPVPAAEEAKTQAETGLATAERGIEFAAQQNRRAEADLPLQKDAAEQAAGRLSACEAAAQQVATELAASEKPLVAAAFTRDATQCLCLASDGRGTFLDAADGQPRRAFDAAAGGSLPTLVAAADDGLFVMARGAAAAAAWSAGDGWVLERTIGDERTPPADDDDPSGPPVDAVLALAFTPDGGLLASGSGRPSRSGEIKLWKTADGTLVRAIVGAHSDTVMALEFSRTGALLASGATDRLAKVHATEDGRHVKTFEGHAGHVLGVAWQTHGRRLATAGADGAIKVWDVPSGEQQRSIAAAKKEVTAIEFLAPGEEVAAATGEPAVRLYHAGSGAVVRQYEAVGDFVQSLAVSPTVVVAGTQDGRLRTWNVASGAVMHTVEPAAATAAK